MRVVEFEGADGTPRVGVVVDETVRIVADGTVHEMLQRHNWRLRIEDHSVRGVPLDQVTFRPLLGDTGRVFAAGLNYEKIYPAGKQPPMPKFPPWFGKAPGTLVAHNQPVLAPLASETFDYEAELAAVLGSGGRHVPVERALDLVAGWTCLNDGSVRAWQRHSVNAGKNFEQSGSIGPWMVTADEIADPQALQLMARVDGEVRQNASTSEMIFSVAEIISYLSQAIELRPGDVIATGSPEGTGGSFDPPRFLEAGQVLEVEIEGIGILRNPVIAEGGTMTDKRSVAERLLKARAQGDFSPEFLVGALDLPQALDLQVAVMQEHLNAGKSVGGWKVGLTSEASRTKLGADERPFGFVLGDRTLESGAIVDSTQINKLSVETEMCFTVGRDVEDVTVGPDEILDYMSHVSAGFELNEARPGSVRPDFFAMVTDCLTNWGIVCGPGVAPSSAESLSATTITMERNGEQLFAGVSSDYVDDHTISLCRLVEQLARHGQTLRAGQKIITGAFARFPTASGDHWRATYQGIGAVEIDVD